LKRGQWIVLAALVVVVAGGWWWRSRGGAEAPKFRTAAVERGVVEATVAATGTVEPVVQVEVGSQVSGTVHRIMADYNSRVHAGQVLCQIEPSSFRARVVQAQAEVAKAEAAVKDAQRVRARARELLKQNYISQAEVDAADVALEQRQAELQQAQAQLAITHVDLANTTIRAPIDGVVIARSIDLGQTVAASLQAPTLFVIANDLSRMQVETRIDEADIGRIHVGQPVRFTVDAFPDDVFEGSVGQVRLEPIVDQGVVTYTIVILTANPDAKLRPGMTANVSVRTARRDDVLKVPSAALRFKPPSPRGQAGSEARAGGARGGGDRAEASGAPGGGRGGAGGGQGARGKMRAGEGAAQGRWASGPAGGARGRSGTTGHRPSGPASTDPEDTLKPGNVYVLRDGKPEPVSVTTGLTDGAFFEVKSESLKPGDKVIVGLEISARNTNLQPPPGMGGPFGGRPGGGAGRR